MNANETLKKKWMSGDFKWEKAYPDEYACKRRCEEIAPDCGGFTYFTTAVLHEARENRSCQLKRYRDSYTYYSEANSEPDKAHHDTISGELLNCMESGMTA